MREHGFFRVAVAAPGVKVGGVVENRKAMEELYAEATGEGVELILFPELATTGYSCGDLLLHDSLLSAATDSIVRLASLTESGPVAVVGSPLELDGILYNAAYVLGNGRILGAVLKRFLPNFNEFYEERWFTSGEGVEAEQTVGGWTYPVGSRLIFFSKEKREFSFAVEVCGDLWVAVPPSSYHTLAGAMVVLNPSASTEWAGKRDYRRNLVLQQSAKTIGGYLYASSGGGESSTDTVYSGHLIVAENGKLLGENFEFSMESRLSIRDLDIDYMAHQRRLSSWYKRGATQLFPRGTEGYRKIPFSLTSTQPALPLRRPIVVHPFVPEDSRLRELRCKEVLSIQARGLATRLSHLGCSSVVIGLSGGLDSTLALLVAVEAFGYLCLPREGIHCYSLPGFGTSSRTKENVVSLCSVLKVPLEIADICGIADEELKLLGASAEKEPAGVVYENVQARQRTAFLMNKANMLGGILIGTGDLSELALGWCTYSGDHISMYSVNCGVPKTMVSFIIGTVADSSDDPRLKSTLLDVMETPISPELLPPDKQGEISQKTEEIIGPYELHDFFLFHLIRCGFSPSKVLMLAGQAFCQSDRHTRYTTGEIKKWLRVFIVRFFQSQFKRSCAPDGPKTGALSLSPRGDWRMASDTTPECWLADLEATPD